MKKNLTLSLVTLLCILLSRAASAQTIISYQNFDNSPSLPSGWYATPNSWYNDTTLGNSSTGYIGASGVDNIVIQDTLAHVGYDSLISAPISSAGYDSITVQWASRMSKHFADSGSTIALYWSTDGTTWNNVSYIENPNNSNWYPENDSTPITLPAGAANRSSLWLMWLADIHFNTSGTYRIDDVTVAGDAITGINDITNQTFAKVYVSSNSNINISIKNQISENLNVELYDLTGRLISKINMDTQNLTIDGSHLSEGMYLVKVSDINNTMVTKVLVK
jgi:hypothetical protein